MYTRKNALHYHAMVLPGIILLLLFSVVPMGYAVIAFQNFKPGRGISGSEWIGLENFQYLMELPDSRLIFFNTIFLAVLKIIANLIVPLVFALLLNEVRVRFLRKSIQTIVYLPHFISWVLLATIFFDVFSLEGIVNQALGLFGIDPVLFYASNSWFPAIIVATDVWKEFGFNAIVYLAALTGINPALYEAASMDGASRFKQLWHVTLPGVKTTVILLATLALGNVMNANFDQIFNMYNPLVYQSADIIDTYVYRVGLNDLQYSLGTAVGLLKSVVSFILVVLSYVLASRFAGYRIF
ncbi:putative aldouronate transport system permease protein [Paenibacillus phyllosphaerae]|uniref:Putative aldouronate transport system permease protein n=1 Tax=Paenibacillus phyllosphaerae TaxID=274593 RepID=A0A7W5AZI4_9BACL|nr:ABC transporter permease subunit [Paenibacillus phyllosphaerae]MBB3111652.1 putative aldouronate transport system permease protein [Paenibacillus phyllosphaerae]